MLETKNFILLLTMALLTSAAYSQIAEGELSEGEEIGPFEGTHDPGTVEANSSQVIDVNISSEISTTVWAGLFGEATGEIVVGADDSVFTWDSAVGRYVYASNQGLNFASDWRPANVEEMESEYPFLVESAVPPSETFINTTTVDSTIQEDEVEGTAAAYTYDSGRRQEWETAFLEDGDSSYFFSSKVISDDEPPTFFTGDIADEAGYQMILPEDESSGNVIEYDIWVELE